MNDVIGKTQMLVRRWPGMFALPLVLLLAVGGAVLSPRAAAAPALDAQAILGQASPAVGLVRGSIGARSISGTAFVIDPQGWLLTAAHVARRAEKLQVELPGMAALDATLIGYDATRDLAILRVNPPSSLPALQLAGDAPGVGDAVAVIGAPRGQPGVITTGEVQGTGISLPGMTGGTFVRVSARVQPGESGAPLLNSQAQVVGVVVASTFDQSRPRGGLAVSLQAIQTVLPQLRQGARMERAWIGIGGGRPGEGRPGPAGEQGAVVQRVMPQSPAATAGLHPGDVVVEFEGDPIHNWMDLLAATGQRQPGQSVHLVVVRDGQRVEVTVTLGVRP